jgi:DTW domain-containing protein YfiP
VILQHPLEVHVAKGSARLLHLSLARSQLITGEVFSTEVLQSLLSGPRQAVLLYPQTPDVPGAAVLSAEQLRDSAELRLIVLDGTWRKSRKMLHLNPLLQSISRLSLSDVQASRYLIRKAHRPDQLSTLEATCAALTHLEAGGGVGSDEAERRFQPLLSAFDGFVGQQMAYRQKLVDD